MVVGMREYARILNLADAVGQRSVFLFGPRQTGKSFLLRRCFPAAPTYNLLLADQFARLSQRPSVMREELLASPPPPGTPVIIDEIQKLPILLDEVHHLIETTNCRFVLTGSSARKLKRGGANLLAGRAWVRHLFPLVSAEIPDYDLLRLLTVGSLPSIYAAEAAREDLLAYAGTYLQEEIQAEAAVRNIGGFSRFLQVAALANAELVNFDSVSRDAGVPARTVADYFGVLEDTLLGCLLPPFGRTIHRKAVKTAKFYFFDVGVCNHLAGRTVVDPRTETFGKCFEHFIFTELRAWLDYRRDDRPLTFWRDYAGHEVDFIVGDSLAIEVKSTEQVHEKQLKNLAMFAEEVPLRHRLVVSLDPAPRRLGDVEILPYREFLARLWGGYYGG